MATKIKSGETVLFIGDSITDCGRRAAEKPLGAGYVKMFNDLMTIREPQKKITIINKGIGGDNVLGLQNRWTDDVLRHKPNFLSIKVGINDLHHPLRNIEPNITPQVFHDTYDEILDRTMKKLPNCQILLIDPFYISAERSKKSFRREVLNLLPAYVGTVHNLSKKYGTKLIKTHEMFQKLLKYHEADTFCPEPVHPNPTGHLAIAEAVYEAFSGNAK